MQFALNEDQIAVRDMARDFAAEKIAPHAIRWDEEKHFPVDVMREAAKLGIGGVYIRDDVGGSGMTRFDAALIFEALAQAARAASTSKAAAAFAPRQLQYLTRVKSLIVTASSG